MNLYARFGDLCRKNNAGINSLVPYGLVNETCGLRLNVRIDNVLLNCFFLHLGGLIYSNKNTIALHRQAKYISDDNSLITLKLKLCLTTYRTTESTMQNITG